VYIGAERLEEFISEAVLYRIDTPALAEGLRQRDDGSQATTGLLAAIGSDESLLEDLALACARREISLPEFLVARKEIEARVEHQKAHLHRTDHQRALREVAGHGDALRSRWPALNLDQRRAILGTVLDRVVVSRARIHGRIQFDPGRLEPVWKA